MALQHDPSNSEHGAGLTVPALAVHVADLVFTYPNAAVPALALGTLQIGATERVLLAGPSGSGKSTLLNLLCGTLVAPRGTVTVLGQSMAALSASQRDRFRATRLGVVFQQFNLVPYLSVIENVLLPMRLTKDMSRSAIDTPRERAHGLLAALGLDPALADRKAASLSVGQQQRVAAARAFLLSPGLIIADEPTSALDTDRRDGFLDLMFAQAARTGSAVLVVSHDAAIGARFDRTVRLVPPTGSDAT